MCGVLVTWLVGFLRLPMCGPLTPPLHALSLLFMGLVSTCLPFNLCYWRKIRCVVLPAHSKWTVYERISNLHKVLNQISSCPWNKYYGASWDVPWERMRGLLKDAKVDIRAGCLWNWRVALCHAGLNLTQWADGVFILFDQFYVFTLDEGWCSCFEGGLCRTAMNRNYSTCCRCHQFGKKKHFDWPDEQTASLQNLIEIQAFVFRKLDKSLHCCHFYISGWLYGVYCCSVIAAASSCSTTNTAGDTSRRTFLLFLLKKKSTRCEIDSIVKVYDVSVSWTTNKLWTFELF